jgi:hypothetical protein
MLKYVVQLWELLVLGVEYLRNRVSAASERTSWVFVVTVVLGIFVWVVLKRCRRKKKPTPLRVHPDSQWASMPHDSPPSGEQIERFAHVMRSMSPRGGARIFDDPSLARRFKDEAERGTLMKKYGRWGSSHKKTIRWNAGQGRLTWGGNDKFILVSVRAWLVRLGCVGALLTCGYLSGHSAREVRQGDCGAEAVGVPRCRGAALLLHHHQNALARPLGSGTPLATAT